MALGVEDIQVLTTDSNPGVAPNKISNAPGYMIAYVDIKLADVPPGPPAYRALRVTPGARDLGPPQISRGFYCGMGQRCGLNTLCFYSEGTTIHDDVTYADMGGRPDGDYTMNVHLLTDEGWM